MKKEIKYPLYISFKTKFYIIIAVIRNSVDVFFNAFTLLFSKNYETFLLSLMATYIAAGDVLGTLIAYQYKDRKQFLTGKNDNIKSSIDMCSTIYTAQVRLTEIVLTDNKPILQNYTAVCQAYDALLVIYDAVGFNLNPDDLRSK